MVRMHEAGAPASIRSIFTFGLGLCTVILSAAALFAAPVSADSSGSEPCAAFKSSGEEGGCGGREGYDLVDCLIEANLGPELCRFVAVETWRQPDKSNEKQVLANIQDLQKILWSQAAHFNEGQKSDELESFEWKGDGYWLFGLRLGQGERRIALSSHLDTVPPGKYEHWHSTTDPFELTKVLRTYRGMKNQEFYGGRGSLDDKGPAIVAFNVLKAVARDYDGDPKLDNVTLEVLFDTSEETGMALPNYLEYLKDNDPGKVPNLGVIYDAMWCVRAEKGIEQPRFFIARGEQPTTGIWIEKLNTDVGPANQIPDEARAVLNSDSWDELEAFGQGLDQRYREWEFDGDKPSAYRRAHFTVHENEEAETLTLVTEVEGAQHGSAPDENRDHGANPLVSLANFLGGLVREGKLARNDVGTMCELIEWTWGTKVFGERHPALKADDEVFTPGNGTTYAVTRFYTGKKPDTEKIELQVDVRYALRHHSVRWDGKSGVVGGDESPSKFGCRKGHRGIFGRLVDEFNADFGAGVKCHSKTAFPPDVRLPTDDSFQRVSQAFEEVEHRPCPRLAIGGGTDAKGNNQLVAAGALFTEFLGPPVNFHGADEGVPIDDLKKGARIIYRLFVNEIEAAGPKSSGR